MVGGSKLSEIQYSEQSSHFTDTINEELGLQMSIDRDKMIYLIQATHIKE